jgi:hypothetical protein
VTRPNRLTIGATATQTDAPVSRAFRDGSKISSLGRVLPGMRDAFCALRHRRGVQNTV